MKEACFVVVVVVVVLACLPVNRAPLVLGRWFVLVRTEEESTRSPVCAVELVYGRETRNYFWCRGSVTASLGL